MSQGQDTVCFFSFVLRDKANVSLFWEIWGPRRLPSDHKIGRKFPFGQKHHQMGSTIIQEDDCPKEEFQDDLIKHILQNIPEMISSFFFMFLEVKASLINIFLNFFIMITLKGRTFE